METQRLLLFFGLAMVLFLMWDAWEKQFNPPPPPVATSQTRTTSSQAGDVPHSNEAIPTSSAPQVSTLPSTAAQLEQGEKILVETDVFRAEINSIGGDLRHVKLLKYPVSVDKPDEPFVLMNDRLPQLFVAQSGFAAKAPSNDGSVLSAPNHKTRYRISKNRYVLGDGQDALQVELQWISPEGVEFIKRYVFKRGSYAIDVQHTINNRTASPWRGNLYQQFRRGREEVAMGIGTTYTYTGAVVWSPEEKYQKISFNDMAEEKFRQVIKGGWGAMIQHYFLGAWIPDKNISYLYSTHDLGNDIFNLRLLENDETRVESGQHATLSSKLYVGPKLQHVLEKLAPGLELTVDYGILTIIAKPIFWLLEKIHALVGNWGWAIIFLTLLIKLAFYKLSETSYRSMAKMRKLTPRLKQLKERYGDDKQKMQQAQMEMFRKEKINPLGGCLPILVQIPVFIALYWVLLESVELRQAPWILWIKDLSIKDPYYVLPILMGASMFIQQRLNPAPMDPMQAKVMMFLPLIFTVFFLFFPSGLVLYWVVNNTLSIAQQAYITKVVVKD